MRAIGIAIPFFRRRSGVPIDAQAQVHFNRVIADGGVVPSGLSGVNAFFSAVKAIYGTTDINTAISAAYDAHYLGYKLGAGSGTTLGQAAQKMYAPKGIFGGIGTGSAFWEGVGVTGNYVQTPSAAINQITGDIEIVARISISDEVGEKTIISKRSGANASYVLSSTSKLLRFRINTTTYDSNASHTFAVNEVYWAKVTRQQSNGEIKFFTSLNGTTWTQLGTTIIGITDSIAVNSVPVIVGVLGDLSSFSMKGNIYRATIANSIGGTPIVDFNANQYTGANTWTSTTSEVWTVNSTGAGLADVTQTTAASQPLLLAHTGENYWFGSGVNGNYLSALTSASNITDDIEIGIYCDYLQKTNQSLGGKTNGGTYIFYLNSIGRPVFQALSNTLMAQSTVGVPISQGWLKASRKRGVSGFVKFFYSAQPSTTPIASINWIELSNVPETSNQPLTIDNVNVNFGAISNGVSLPSTGKIYRGWIANSIGGTPVVDFNPASYNPSVSQTEWSSATGEVWSLNVGTATTGYKGVLVDRTIMQSDGIDDALSNPTFSCSVGTNAVYYANKKFNSSKLNLIVETSVNYNSNVGISLSSNDGTNINGQGVNANNGVNASRFISSTLNLKLNTSLINVLDSATNETITFLENNSIISRNAFPGMIENTAVATSTGIYLFSRAGTSIFANINLNLLILTSRADTTPQQTAMYNYLRSINGNSF